MTKTDAPNTSSKLMFTLDVPVTYQGETHADITYRRPNGGDMRKYLNGRGGMGDDIVNLMVDICELPKAFFDSLDGMDFMAFSTELQPFLTGARKTSKS
jgi:hypothetical protein